jgi:hypothetical protein
VLTDNSRTFGVIDLTGEPELFFDRVDEGDDRWEAVLDSPYGQVQYMLIERSDLISDRYPGIEDGDVDGFEVVANNDRYTVVRVDDEDPGTETTAAAAGPSNASESADESSAESEAGASTTGTTTTGGSETGGSVQGVPQGQQGGGGGAGLGSAEPAPFEGTGGN